MSDLIQGSASILLQLPIQTVWDYVSNPENFEDWIDKNCQNWEKKSLSKRAIHKEIGQDRQDENATLF